VVPQIAPPRGIIFTYQRALLRHILASEPLTPLPFVAGQLYPLPSAGGQIAVLAEFGIGAPAVGLQFELLIALGVTQCISIGTAGGLQPGVRAGQLTVCTAAVRDEGVSHHYTADSSPLAWPSPELTERFAAELAERGANIAHGPTWTTDAPFRETRAEVAHYQAQGVLTVEMEAAALFAIGAARGVAVAAGFVVSDVLAEPEWNPQFRAPETTAGLVMLYEAAKAALR
jgi:uridine phosphorylase